MIKLIKDTVLTSDFIFVLILLGFILVVTLLLLENRRDNIRLKKINQKVKDLIAGDYSQVLDMQGSSEITNITNNLNDLSEVIRLTQSILELLKIEDEYELRDLITQIPELMIDSQDGNGEYLSLRVRFALIRRESGFISGLVAVLHDTTEQEKEERERRLFVSNVSHELRTPLTSVKSYLEALDEGALSEPVAPDFIKVSLDETNRMMLNRFDKMRGPDEEKKYDLVRDYPITSVWIEIDTDKMTQVIDNILNNAIKYSPDGGKITVTMKTTDDQMILSISDQGLGIPKQDLPRIFDRFYRVDRARSRAQGGTGLGLAIAKEIVKQHEGFIWAKSEYGKGSTFTIVLPYDKDAVKEEVWEDEVED